MLNDGKGNPENACVSGLWVSTNRQSTMNHLGIARDFADFARARDGENNNQKGRLSN